MNKAALIQAIKAKQSFLCVGLDTDIDQIPTHLLAHEDPIFEFNKQIIDATHSFCVAYKPNTAFYETLGEKGALSLKKTMAYIPENCLKIADAKRGDIGNTADRYAQTFFGYYKADAVTIAPYMGKDSVSPFLNYPNKWSIVLGLTSNAGAEDFQFLPIHEKQFLFEKVVETVAKWGSSENTMFVVGATRPEYFEKIRAIVPDHFLLVPGIGAQGGDLDEVCRYGLNQDVGLLVNATRSIIYADKTENFAQTAAKEAQKIQQEMRAIIENNFSI